MHVQSEIIEVVEATLKPEIGTNGRPMVDSEDSKMGRAYEKLDLYG